VGSDLAADPYSGIWAPWPAVKEAAILPLLGSLEPQFHSSQILRRWRGFIQTMRIISG